MHNSIAFVLRVGITVAIGLFIDCHFLFEVQLCLSLHIEVFSFQDNEKRNQNHFEISKIFGSKYFKYMVHNSVVILFRVLVFQ